MLTLEGVSYRYPATATPALSGLSLSVGEGEVVGLVGANDSGKSTLCLVASGLAPRVIGGKLTGRLLLDGEDCIKRPMHELVSRIGICFQNPATQLSGVNATVFEEVAFGPVNLGRGREELIAGTRAALALLGIEHLASRDPRHLSGGQMQLVAVAGLLALGTRYLVLDEPTALLDPAGTRLVADALERLASGGASILIAEHKTDLLEGLCSRLVALEAGRVVLDGPIGSVLDDPRLGELGVAAPAARRLRSAARQAGIDPTLLEADAWRP